MATISDILQAQGEAAAKERRARGTMWGSLAQYAGTIPREILADKQLAQDRARKIAYDEQVRQKNEQEIASGKSKLDEEMATRKRQQDLQAVLNEPGVYDAKTPEGINLEAFTEAATRLGHPETIPDAHTLVEAGMAKHAKTALDKAQADYYTAGADERRNPPQPPQITEAQATANAFAATFGTTPNKLTPDQWKGFFQWKNAQAPDKPEAAADKYRDLYARKLRGETLKPEDTSWMQAYEADKKMTGTNTFNLSQSAKASDNPAVQRQLEQQYRGVLGRVLSSRSSGLTIESQKIDQANHLLAVFDQYEDPNTHEYKIPRVQYNELALGLARLLSPAGQVGIQLENEIKQKTASGDVASWVTYLTGTPVTGTTQAVLQMMKDSIERQGTVAESNRDTYLETIREQAPTDLDPKRQETLEQSLLKLNRVRTKAGAPPPPGAATGTAAQPAAGRVRVVGPNGETGTIPVGTALLPGWKESR